MVDIIIDPPDPLIAAIVLPVASDATFVHGPNSRAVCVQVVAPISVDTYTKPLKTAATRLVPSLDVAIADHTLLDSLVVQVVPLSVDTYIKLLNAVAKRVVPSDDDAIADQDALFGADVAVHETPLSEDLNISPPSTTATLLTPSVEDAPLRQSLPDVPLIIFHSIPGILVKVPVYPIEPVIPDRLLYITILGDVPLTCMLETATASVESICRVLSADFTQSTPVLPGKGFDTCGVSCRYEGSIPPSTVSLPLMITSPEIPFVESNRKNEEPVTPAAPVANSIVPVAPLNDNPSPAGPVAPVWPVSPVAPVGPMSPVSPLSPVAPVGPMSPVSPLSP